MYQCKAAMGFALNIVNKNKQHIIIQICIQEQYMVTSVAMRHIYQYNLKTDSMDERGKKIYTKEKVQ